MLHILAETYRQIFPFKYFNVVQTEILDHVLHDNNHLVVGAPTGCGKTVIFELAIIELLIHLDRVGNGLKKFKIIYVSPTKALCNEVCSLWANKFKPFNLTILALTGDSVITDLSGIEPYNIIITTPEKFDSLTRNWKTNLTLIKMIKLMLIDEIHVLSDIHRGAVLETIVSRAKSFSYPLFPLAQIAAPRDNAFINRHIRFVVLSSTIPNLEDIGEWIGDPVKVFRIQDDQRPVKLNKIVIGYSTNGKPAFQFDMSLNYKLPALIKQYWMGKPALIFCGTRRSVEIARNVLEVNLNLPITGNRLQILQSIAEKVTDQDLALSITKGIAFHHAGLDAVNRSMVEEAFRRGQIPILLSTSSLAVGINLPAHLVIIKSTEMYFQGTTEEIPENTIIQMMGRAGRLQQDTTGTVLILTKEESKVKYENLVSGTILVESNLHHHILDHLNSEIVLGTIRNLESAMSWIRTTYLYVRVLKNPSQYGIAADLIKEQIIKKLEELCIRQLQELAHAGLIAMDLTTFDNIVSTVPGSLMARYYLNFDTMKTFKKINGSETVEQIFNVIISCPEFYNHQLRVGEKKILNELNHSNKMERLRFPINGKICSVSEKISCLIQAVLGNILIPNASLQTEAMKLLKIAKRLVKCLIDYVKTSHFPLGNFIALISCIQIAKSFEAHLWENSPFVSKQLENIDHASSILLCQNSLRTIGSILHAGRAAVNRILQTDPPFGAQVIESAAMLPTYSMQLEVISLKRIRIKVSQTNIKYLHHQTKYQNDITLLIGDNNNKLLFINDNGHFSMSEYGSFDRIIRLRPISEYLTAYLIHQRLVGIDRKAEIAVALHSTASSVLWHQVPYQPSLKSLQNPKPTRKSKSNLFRTKQKGTGNQATIRSYFPLADKNGRTPETASRQQYNAQNRSVTMDFRDVIRVDTITKITETACQESNGSKIFTRDTAFVRIATQFVEPMESRLSKFSAPSKKTLSHDFQAKERHSVYEDDNDYDFDFDCSRENSTMAGPSSSRTTAACSKTKSIESDEKSTLSVYDNDPFESNDSFDDVIQSLPEYLPQPSRLPKDTNIKDMKALDDNNKVAGFVTAKSILDPHNMDSQMNEAVKHRNFSSTEIQSSNLQTGTCAPQILEKNQQVFLHENRSLNEVMPNSSEGFVHNAEQEQHSFPTSNRDINTSDTSDLSSNFENQRLSLGMLCHQPKKSSTIESILRDANYDSMEEEEEELKCVDNNYKQVIKDSYSKHRQISGTTASDVSISHDQLSQTNNLLTETSARSQKNYDTDQKQAFLMTEDNVETKEGLTCLPFRSRSLFNGINSTILCNHYGQDEAKNKRVNTFKEQMEFMETDVVSRKEPAFEISAMVAKGIELIESGRAPASYYREPYLKEIRKRHLEERVHRSFEKDPNGSSSACNNNPFKFPPNPQTAPKLARKSFRFGDREHHISNTEQQFQASKLGNPSRNSWPSYK